MKRLISSICSVLVSLFVMAAGVQSILNRNFMDLKTAETKWGAKPFEAEKFKKGNKVVKASMAVDLIRSKIFVGKTFEEVKAVLGNYDGYFESDSIPAYIIDIKKKPDKETWQVLFLPDKTGIHVEEVKIHKNCCDTYESIIKPEKQLSYQEISCD